MRPKSFLHRCNRKSTINEHRSSKSLEQICVSYTPVKWRINYENLLLFESSDNVVVGRINLHKPKAEESLAYETLHTAARFKLVSKPGEAQGFKLVI